jgi:hypothetical protein
MELLQGKTFEAIPALDKAIERSAGDREANARLARLRESLPR